MGERKIYAAEDFKGCNGREVTVRAVIDDGDPEKGPNLILLFDHDRRMTVGKSAIVEILPEELRVGDRVQHVNGAIAEVRAIDGDAVLVRYCGPSDRGSAACWLLIDLTLVERAKP